MMPSTRSSATAAPAWSRLSPARRTRQTRSASLPMKETKVWPKKMLSMLMRTACSAGIGWPKVETMTPRRRPVQIAWMTMMRKASGMAAGASEAKAARIAAKSSFHTIAARIIAVSVSLTIQSVGLFMIGGAVRDDKSPRAAL